MEHEEDFAAYMRARWPALVRSLVMLGCAPDEAEDVTQTALTRCLTRWGGVRRADDVDAYVYRILLNTWATSRRRRWWQETPTERLPEHAAHDETDGADLRQALQGALADLSPDHRAVLVLRFVADLTEAQVAVALGVPVGTVKSRVARAIARIDTAALREETP